MFQSVPDSKCIHTCRLARVLTITSAVEVYGRERREDVDPLVWGFARVSRERFQVLRYGPGQRYGPHLDGQGRFATAFLYLNDGYEGGGTYFPFVPNATHGRAPTPEEMEHWTSPNRMSMLAHACTLVISLVGLISKGESTAMNGIVGLSRSP